MAVSGPVLAIVSLLGRWPWWNFQVVPEAVLVMRPWISWGTVMKKIAQKKDFSLMKPTYVRVRIWVTRSMGTVMGHSHMTCIKTMQNTRFCRHLNTLWSHSKGTKQRHSTSILLPLPRIKLGSSTALNWGCLPGTFRCLQNIVLFNPSSYAAIYSWP